MVITTPINRWYIMIYSPYHHLWPQWVYRWSDDHLLEWEYTHWCHQTWKAGKIHPFVRWFFHDNLHFIGDFLASHAWCHRMVNHGLTLAHTVKHASFWTAAAFFVFRGLAPLSASPWSPEDARRGASWPSHVFSWIGVSKNGGYP